MSPSETQYAIVLFNEKGQALGELLFTSWAMGACSTATLSGICNIYVPRNVMPEDFMADIINAIYSVAAKSGYDAQRIFVNIPNPYETSVGEWLLKLAGKPQPIYSFANRAHASGKNHLYDLDMRVLYKWRQDYVAQKASAYKAPDMVGDIPPPVANAAVVQEPDWLDPYTDAVTGGSLRAGE